MPYLLFCNKTKQLKECSILTGVALQLYSKTDDLHCSYPFISGLLLLLSASAPPARSCFA